MGFRPSLPDFAAGDRALARGEPTSSTPSATGIYGLTQSAATGRLVRDLVRAARRRSTWPASARDGSEAPGAFIGFRTSEPISHGHHTFFCIDGHTCGNPVRLVAGGGPLLEGATMMEKRAHFLAEYDWIRTGLMFEPRGHDMMSGSILYPPTRDDCDIAILFIETSGCLPMCGHGTIGTVTMAIEHGLVKPRDAGPAAARHAGRPGESPSTSRTATMSRRCASPTCRPSSTPRG